MDVLTASPEARSFRCTGCGNCCRELRVAVTALDVRRLSRATGREPAALVDWLAPDAVDMTGEPESFVELGSGRRLMVLRHAEQPNAGCMLLGDDARCTAYAARPRDCQAFPFDFERSADAAHRRLTLLPLKRCDFASDGHVELEDVAAIDATRWSELEQYQAFVARWNRRAWHQRRLHQAIGSAARFLAAALAALET
jgi:Fe-S-cluster containining protein